MLFLAIIDQDVVRYREVKKKGRLRSLSLCVEGLDNVVNPGGEGELPYKSDGGGLVEKFQEHPKRYQNSFPPLRGTNSTTTNYITCTANFNSDKVNFQTLSSQGRFESIVINLTETTLAAVILGFSSLSGTNPQI